MRYVLALDQGTTSSRAILFDEEGAAVCSAQREFRQIFPQPGWVEHDPREIFETQRAVAREALQKKNISLKDLACVGIANQRETTILWDRQTGEPIHNVRAERGELAFGTVDTWLVWKLTGNRTHVTDPSNASRTMLFDIARGDWDEELLRLLGVPRALLPDVHPSAHAFGMLPAAVLGEPLIIGGIAGDQQAALFGQACHRPGMAKNTYGTGCFMLLHTGERVVHSANGLVSTACAQVQKKEYALEGSVFIGGAVVQWLRDELQFFSSSSEIERLAASVLDNGGVYLVPAFVGLGAPYWDPRARGAMLGLTRGTSRAHIARAALESIAFQCADVLQAMQKDAGEKLAELRVDGGAAANDLLMQFQADLLGVPVVRPKVLETTALGAAYLAGLTVNLWKSRDEIAAHWKLERRFEPRMERAEAQEKMARWRDAIGRSRNWASA